mmetsp:Transcript_2493/g.5793  ORF Transcript_2493/g.5793 Transcript_2493/m.5793 type:complete len:259 (+) Transcript_2493:944-1720(+)
MRSRLFHRLLRARGRILHRRVIEQGSVSVCTVVACRWVPELDGGHGLCYRYRLRHALLPLHRNDRHHEANLQSDPHAARAQQVPAGDTAPCHWRHLHRPGQLGPPRHRGKRKHGQRVLYKVQRLHFKHRSYLEEAAHLHGLCAHVPAGRVNELRLRGGSRLPIPDNGHHHGLHRIPVLPPHSPRTFRRLLHGVLALRHRAHALHLHLPLRIRFLPGPQPNSTRIRGRYHLLQSRVLHWPYEAHGEQERRARAKGERGE